MAAGPKDGIVDAGGHIICSKIRCRTRDTSSLNACDETKRMKIVSKCVLYCISSSIIIILITTRAFYLLMREKR